MILDVEKYTNMAFGNLIFMSSLQIYILYACTSTLYDNREGVVLKV